MLQVNQELHMSPTINFERDQNRLESLHLESTHVGDLMKTEVSVHLSSNLLRALQMRSSGTLGSFNNLVIFILVCCSLKKLPWKELQHSLT